MEKIKVQLGDRVKCRLTGFIGLTTSKMTEMTGNIRWGVSPPADVEKGSIPDAYLVDDFAVEVLEAEVVKPIPTPTPKFIFGDKVRDVSTDIIGTITSLNEYIAGCIMYIVRFKDGDGNPATTNVPEDLLEIVTPRSTPAPTPGDKPGGPSGRVSLAKVSR